jgi:tight adherence protein C
MMMADALTLAFCFFLLIAGAFVMLYRALYSEHPLQRRLEEMAGRSRVGEGRLSGEAPPEHGLGEVFLDWARKRMPQPNLEKPAVEKMVRTLRHAGFYDPTAPKAFQAIRLLSALAGALLGYLVSPFLGRSGTILMLIGVGLGYEIPIFAIRRMSNARQLRITKELPDIIDLLVVSVECGLGLQAAIRVVGRESGRQGKIMGEQLSTLSNEVSAGSTLGEGLRAVADRTGVDDVRSLAAMLIQSEKLGTEIGSALRGTSEQLRVKRSQRAEEAAQKLPIKMVFPMVLFLLPAMMAILIGPALVQIFRAFRFN